MPILVSAGQPCCTKQGMVVLSMNDLVGDAGLEPAHCRNQAITTRQERGDRAPEK